MNNQEELGGDYHEHPYFNGQRHRAVWVKTWSSNGTNDEAPDDAPISCAICGKLQATVYKEII